MSSLAEDYAPGEDIPLGSYAVLVGAYLVAVAGLGVVVSRGGRRLPRVTMADVALVGMATHKLSRRITKSPVTSPIRAPFTRPWRRAGWRR